MALTQVQVGMGGNSNAPAFNCYCSTAQTITTGGSNTVSVNTKVFDTASCFNNTSSTATLNGLSAPAYSFTPNVAGYYQINASTILASGTGVSQTYILKNEFVYAYGAGGSSDGANVLSSISMLIYLNGTGDYIRLGIYQNSGGNRNLTSGQTGFNNISGCLVRAA